MSRRPFWRKALTVPAAIALALGGVALTAAPASAAEAGLTVTSPIDGSTVDSRTVTVQGSVFGGSTVIVYDQSGNNVLARSNVGGSFGQPTPYSLTLPAYADDAPVAQTIVVGGLYGGSGIPQQSVSFALPAAAPVGNFTVTAPTNGQTVDSRTVTFTGTGTDGSTVNVLDANGNRIPGTTAAVVVNGQWSTTGTYPADAPVAQTITANQVTGGAGRGEQTVSFTLPAVTPVGNFTVTAPTNGQTVDSRTVTFTGTGTDGSTVNVLDANGNRIPGTTAAVVVNGQWSTTGTYPADAPVAQTISANQVTGGAGRGEQTVSFTLPAAVTPTPTPTPTPAPAGNGSSAAPVGGSSSVASGSKLAVTGSADVMPLVGAGALALMAGAGIFLYGKRRRVHN
ncbi:hypothetical protein C1632_08170 [Microbacterium testaceum]|uniref:LPXTG cell wall anchor domain-containing protein n=1 Tax=Microbacterium testaceum TaxID=2033 RepID=UPI000CCEA7FB|nr:LPXTG cell wall anchor domain-containing protein [Microbacterium testaceum]PNW09060.1 hypothetical protein C1632_08170 [Microbacterium testaceum]